LAPRINAGYDAVATSRMMLMLFTHKNDCLFYCR
jgi:hypothetical protein